MEFAFKTRGWCEQKLALGLLGLLGYPQGPLGHLLQSHLLAHGDHLCLLARQLPNLYYSDFPNWTSHYYLVWLEFNDLDQRLLDDYSPISLLFMIINQLYVQLPFLKNTSYTVYSVMVYKFTVASFITRVCDVMVKV